MLFPNLSNFEDGIEKLMLTRAGNNQLVSNLMPWFRLTSFAGANGLVMESTPKTESFETRYGGTDITALGGTKSGRVGTTLSGNSVYTIGDDRGFRPSPTIEGLNVEFGAGGINRKCKFAIKAYTLKQAELLSQYFMEPGFTILVEFGWNTNESYGQRATLNACEATKYLNYTYLKDKQKNSGFQYDGFLGYITGANLKSADGETYIIDVDLTAIGDIALYLQQHRGGDTVDNTNPEGGKPYSESAIESLIPGKVGKALFYQMFNRLPQAKQTKEVKNLVNTNPEAINENNYINMDDEIRKVMADNFSEGGSFEASENDSDAEIPEGVNILSEASYIRLGLAFDILNSYSSNLKPKTNSCGTTTTSYIIDYKNTICRGFENIFSIDGSKLLIPNRNTPDFGLLEVLTATSEKELYKITDVNGNLTKKPIDLAQPKGDIVKCFPQSAELSTSSRYKKINNTIPQPLPANSWGFLEDLFINFEFFCEVLNKANYVTKDIYYELLNGVSSAANSIWHFEIEYLPSPHTENLDCYSWQIVDYNLCGTTPDMYEKATKFQSTGAETPFITSELSMDLPAAMKNQIVAQRSAGKVDTKQEGSKPQSFDGIFALKQDPVLTLLDSFQEIDAEPDTEDADDKQSKSEEEDEVRKKNMEMFTSKATVVCMEKNREADLDTKESGWVQVLTLGIADGADANVDELMAVVAWNDASLFRALDKKDKGSLKANNVLVPITFNFTIHGISGIKTGDLFRILDLPKQYTNSVFQVVEVSHDLGNNLWTTNVKGKLRNIN
jgi:hypothetical protein